MQPSNGDFDLGTQLQISIAAQDIWLASEDLDEKDYGWFNSTSPLTSADPSPCPSPQTTPIDLAFDPAPCTSPPISASHPSSNLSTSASSDLCHASETASGCLLDRDPDCDPDFNQAPPKKCRKAQSKAQSKANKKKKKLAYQTSVFSHHAARPEVTAKFVDAKSAIQTETVAREASVARTAYVALDDNQRTKKMPTLEELVGEGSKYNFTLVKAGDG